MALNSFEITIIFTCKELFPDVLPGTVVQYLLENIATLRFEVQFQTSLYALILEQ